LAYFIPSSEGFLNFWEWSWADLLPDIQSS
jgi:hypothetical protein